MTNKESENTPVEDRINPGRLRLLRIIMVLLSVFLVILVYGGYICIRTIGLYNHIKEDGHGWSSVLHRADGELGFAPVPEAMGAMIVPEIPDIPVRLDQNGFRIPMDRSELVTGNGSSVLSIGCSFTFGAGVRASETFTYLLGGMMEGQSHNAGVCSYGLAQMMLVARRTVPEVKPDYLIVQYSPWLVARSVSPFAPVYAGKLPVPVFYEDGTRLMLHPPVFLSRGISIDADEYRTENKDIGDFISFLVDVGLPLYVNDDVNMAIYGIKRVLNTVPTPSRDFDWVVRSVYADIGETCTEAGTQMVILVLGRTCDQVDVPYHLFPEHAVVVNAHRALVDSLPAATQQQYIASYGILGGNPPRLVDPHPNRLAHERIASTIFSALSSSDRL